MRALGIIRTIRDKAHLGPLFGVALALGCLIYYGIRAAHGQRHAWAGMAGSLVLVALQGAAVPRRGQPAAPAKEPPPWARSDSLVYGFLAAFAVGLGTLALTRPLLGGPVWVAALKTGGSVGLALGLAWGALRVVSLLPLRAARLVGLAVTAAVIVGILASAP